MTRVGERGGWLTAGARFGVNSPEDTELTELTELLGCQAMVAIDS